MEIEDELICYHSDDEKDEQLHTTAGVIQTQTKTRNSKNRNRGDGETEIIKGEMDSKTAIRNAKYDKLQIFLDNIDCGDYANVFINEGFESINDLYNIRLEDLFAIEIPRGHARRLLNAIKQHKNDLANSMNLTMNSSHSNSNSNSNKNSLQLGDPTMSIIDDGSIVDVSFIAGSEDNESQQNINVDENGNELKQSTIMATASTAQNNASIIIYPGKKIPKSKVCFVSIRVSVTV